MGGTSMQTVASGNEAVSDAPPGPRQDCSNGAGKFDEQFHLVAYETGRELGNVPYRITASTGEVFDGTTDANGFTRRIVTVGPAKLTIEIFCSEGEETISDDK